MAAGAGALLQNGPRITIRRASGPITIDGGLSDEGWSDATPMDTWYEARPADNIPASVRSVALITYDDSFLYVAFDLEDPDPRAIRAPIRDRDDIPPSADFAGLYLDPAGEGKLAQEFAGTPSGVQYDGLYSEATGPDSAPDFFWECAGRVNDHGWTLEMRIPFSSLRYKDPDPSHWGILLYRNVPRGFRYEYYSSRMPRDRACALCNARILEGLSGLPSGSHWVVAPYLSASGVQEAGDGLGSPLGETEGSGDAGLDLKWLPTPSTVIDATWNPDFSQIESDTAQITANERFALFVPEKRTFFMESADLFTTPLSAAYTRTITAPRWGARASGVGDGYTYTVLAGEDRGGGLAIIPGPESSDLAPQDFESFVAIGRFRKAVGRSFASLLFTDREIRGGGYNRVIGPDLEWWLSDTDIVLAQLLLSWSETPNRPDQADEWDGRKLSGFAGELTWLRRTGGWDAALSYQATSDEFRADNGFMPQVGFRKGYAELGHSFWPKESPVTRLRFFTFSRYVVDQQGDLLFREVTPGFGFDSILDSFVRLEVGLDEIRSGHRLFRRTQLRPTIRFTPGKLVPTVQIQARIGDEVDFTHSRPADGVTFELATELRPADRLQLAMILNRRWLDVEDSSNGRKGRLFTADVARLKGVYSFSVRSWLRLIAQWVETRRDPSLYADQVESHSGDFAGSLTFAYKLSWQTVLYVGYADSRALDEGDVLQQAERQAFVKVSYAFQR